MGKSQKKRQMRRHNPMRVPDSHLPKGLAAALASTSKEEAILPIIQKMDSPDAAERKWACVAVSNLIQNDPSTRRLLQGKNVVGSLITRLTDSEEEVVVEAGGALRNLCIDGGYDICAEMYNKNILTPLKTFIPKISVTLAQFLENPKNAPENVHNIMYEFADNVITILWCLSETSNKALNAINQISLVPFLMSFLGARDKLPISTVASAAHCLYVLTDDNYPAIQEVRSNGAYTACLLSVARPDENQKANGKGKAPSDDREVTLQVLCAGILKNISPIPPPSVAALADIDNEVVLPTIQLILSSISLPEINSRAEELIAQEIAMPDLKNLSIKGSPKSDHKSPAEIELAQIERKLRTVQLSLEILTGVCATLPDPEPVVDEGGDEDENEDEEMEDDDAEMAEDDAPAPTTSTTIHLPPFVPSLLGLIQPTELTFPPFLDAISPHPPTTSAIVAVHIAALECLNNIFLALATSLQAQQAGPSSADATIGRDIWTKIWAALEAVGTEVNCPGQGRRKDMWEVAVGVLWGIAVVWKGAIVPEDSQVNLLIQLCNVTSDPSLKVKCIGTLECLAQYRESIESNKLISQYLLSLVPSPVNSPGPSVEPHLQAVSALIDIFSDEMSPYDINFRQSGYLDELVGSVESVRKAIRGIDKKHERDLRRRGEEVRDNLVAFIEYRRGLQL
ncbi:armadillo-type protein [Irpex rosettiformis]|uniref:Armadillo-type protein n=1 Tax=Irpex rosettiformis TaxID=378272 RepID=A0ACB8UJS8_9APHY|nr:armadillo-type protein [Irpex rosettiformis]